MSDKPSQNLISQPTNIKGNVIFGKGCIVHPCVSILAENGDIIIGDYNIIEERTIIQNRGLRDHKGTFQKANLEIGSYNIFETDSTVEHCKIGDCNQFETRSHIENGAKIGTGCVIGALSKVVTSSEIQNSHKVFNSGKPFKTTDSDLNSQKKKVLSLYEVLLNKMIPKVQKTN